MFTRKNIGLALIAVFVLLLSGCGAATFPSQAHTVPPVPPAGQVWLAQPGTTLYLMNQIVTGGPLPGAQVLAKGGMYLMAAPLPEGQGFMFTMMQDGASKVAGTQPTIDWLKATGGKGNIANSTDMKTFTAYMTANGWKAITWKEIPTVITEGIKAAWAQFQVDGLVALEATKEAVATIGNTMITIFVLPIDTVPLPLTNEQCTQQQDLAVGCGYDRYE